VSRKLRQRRPAFTFGTENKCITTAGNLRRHRPTFKGKDAIDGTSSDPEACNQQRNRYSVVFGVVRRLQN
jgi:hypothetical protein